MSSKIGEKGHNSKYVIIILITYSPIRTFSDWLTNDETDLFILVCSNPKSLQIRDPEQIYSEVSVFTTLNQLRVKP